MKNMKKFFAMTMTATVLVSTVFTSNPVYAASKVEKDETVYVNQEADGEIRDITVTNWLKNIDAETKLEDYSDLKEIKNIKGDEAFKQDKNGNIIWDTDKKDIYYQGNIDKESPVNVLVQYEFDGKDVNPSEIIGKNGTVKITIQYINNAKYEEEIHGVKTKLNTPFLMATMVDLPVDKFSKIEVSQGKIISEGSNQMVMVYGMPGLAEDLHLPKDLKKEMDEKLSSIITITAEVKDFSMDSIYTVATPDLLKDIDVEEINSLDDVDHAINKLVNASDELLNGSEKLSNGLTNLKKNFNKYTKGVNKLGKGSNDLKKGAGALEKGVNTYTTGVSQITSGASLFVAGTGTLVTGINSYIEGEKKIDTGITSLYNSLNTFYTENWKVFSDKLSTFLKKIYGEEGLAANVSAFNSSINEDSGAGKQAFDGLNACMNNSNKKCEDSIKKLQELRKTPELTQEQINSIDEIIIDVQTVKKTDETAKGIGSALKQSLSENIKELKQGVDTLSKNAEILNGYNTKIDAGIKDKMLPGATSLYQGIKSLSENNVTIQNGANTLTTKGETLTTGITELNKNTPSLKSSVKKLAKGAKKLDLGATDLKKATKKVGNGVGQLKDGSTDLKDGMNNFKTEGTGKLKAEYDLNVRTVIDRFKVLLNGAEDYKSFSGISDDMNGSVKFIFCTEEITEENERD